MQSKDEPKKDVQGTSRSERRSGGSSGGRDGGGIHTAVVGLLRALPGTGETRTETEQKAFIDAFTYTVKFLYPAEKGEAEGA